MANQVLAQEQPDVVFLQEASLAPTEVAGFAKVCRTKGKGCTTYFQPSLRHKGGGVLTLVNKAFPQRPAVCKALDSAQMVGVFVSGWLLLNMYVPPREEGPGQAAQLLHDAFLEEALQPSHPWLLGGDFNAVPTDSAVADLLHSFNGSTWTVGAPTRWLGSREIDWLCSNQLSSLSKVRFASWHLSDHKGLVVDFGTPRPATKVGVLPRVADLRKPKELSVEAWRAALERAWEASTEVSELCAKLHDGSGCCAVVCKNFGMSFRVACRPVSVLPLKSVVLLRPLRRDLLLKGLLPLSLGSLSLVEDLGRSTGS